jgi:hypothetical protein
MTTLVRQSRKIVKMLIVRTPGIDTYIANSHNFEFRRLAAHLVTLQPIVAQHFHVAQQQLCSDCQMTRSERPANALCWIEWNNTDLRVDLRANHSKVDHA